MAVLAVLWPFNRTHAWHLNCWEFWIDVGKNWIKFVGQILHWSLMLDLGIRLTFSTACIRSKYFSMKNQILSIHSYRKGWECFLIFRVKLGLSLQIISFQEASPCPQAGPSLSSVLEWDGWEVRIDTGKNQMLKWSWQSCVFCISVSVTLVACVNIYTISYPAQAEAESSASAVND